MAKRRLKNWATVKEAAEYYDVSRQRIHQLIAKGFLGETRMLRDYGHDLVLIPFPFRRKLDPTGQLERKEKDEL